MLNKKNYTSMKVSITDQEIAMLNIISSMRSLVSRATGTKDRKISPERGVTIDLDGLIGEYAYCKANNLFMDIVPTPRSGSYDCVGRSGKKLDIKTTRYENGRLLSTLKVNPDIDYYILAIINKNEITFPGYASKNQLIRKENIVNLGHGEGYALTQDKLKKFNQ